MTSLSWNQLREYFPQPLYIPDGVEKMSTCEAAKAYAEAGFYVLPVNPKTKNPGSMLGAGWPDLSTRDIATIEKYFRNPETAIALHVGKSGALVFDVDEPNNLPPLLLRELFKETVLSQSTRLVGDKRRAHYIFQVEDGSRYGNSIGSLGDGWGDIRGCNGVIIASPSNHVHEYGYYKWQKTGIIPKLPLSIEMMLPKRKGGSVTHVSEFEAQSFFNKYVGNSYPELLQSKLAYLKENPPVQGGRHGRFQIFLLGAFADSSVGFYPANLVLAETLNLFNSMKPKTEQGPKEFVDMVRWAIGKVDAMTIEEKALHAYKNAPHLDKDIMKWVRSHGN
jgi:hypothetical protein